MDLAAVMGLLAFAVVTIITVFDFGGMLGYRPLVNTEALLFVLGGTFCALLVHYPLKQVAGLNRVLGKALFSAEEDTSGIVSALVSFCQKAKKGGFLSLQEDLKHVRNSFLKMGVQMVIDGADAEFIRNMLETEIRFTRNRHASGQELLNAMGRYAPAFGILGAILGVVVMLASVEETAAIPQRISRALVAAFFGLAAGYLIFLPMGGKLRRYSEEELLAKEIVLRGVLLLKSGATPSVMEASLKVCLDPAKRSLVKGA